MNDLFESLKYFNYFYFIQKILEFLKSSENLDIKLKQNKFQFRYLINILLDSELIKKHDDYEAAVDFIESNDFDISKLVKKVNKIKKCQLNYFQDASKYDINLDENNIKYTIEEKSRIGRNKYIKIYKREFNLKMFNKGIIKALKNDLTNFEKNLFKTTKFNEEYCSEYYQPFKNAFNNIITNILKSKAAQNFFRDKYQKKYNYLKYHFNNDLLINEILKKISFAPIFNEQVNSYTDPVDLSITINSIPGEYCDNKVKIYNKKVLQLGRLVLFALREIFGHYLRRYYHYLTHGIIPFWTKEDNSLYTREESGFYIETKFLGMDPVYKSALSINDTLCFLNLDKFDDYPIKKNKKFIIDKIILENIINKNKEIFDFIGNKDGQIKLEDYLTLIKPRDSYNISCRRIPNQDCIYLNEYFF